MLIETLNTLDKDQFRAWLESMRGQVVGKARIPCDCPVARFLTVAPNGPHMRGILVDGNYINVNDPWMPDGHGGLEHRRYQTPYWASAFIRAVDETTPQFGSITAERALELLEKMT